MPKVSKKQVDDAASAFCGRLISGLGLQKALTCNLQIGRMLRAEKKRRKKLDEECKARLAKKDRRKAKKKTDHKAVKSKTSNGDKESPNELPQLTSDSTCSSGDGRREP